MLGLMEKKPSQPRDPELANEDAQFAESVRDLREGLGLSQGDLVKRLHQLGLKTFHQTTVSRIEKRERPVRIGEAKVIATALDSTVGEMTAATDERRAFRSLVDDVSEFVAARRGLQGAAVELGELRVMLEKSIEEVLEVDRVGWSDDELRGSCRALIERAKSEVSEVDWGALISLEGAGEPPPDPQEV